MLNIAIFGAGPSGLFAAGLLLKAGHRVTLYEKTSGAGKKFLVAGHSGLNLTHSDPLDEFSKRFYENASLFKSFLTDFGAEDMKQFYQELGAEVFTGSSGRVFPKEMKAGKVLLKWLGRLKQSTNFELITKSELVNITNQKSFTVKIEGADVTKEADYLILALGGASWKKTGSDGKWVDLLTPHQIQVNSFAAVNCGYNIEWSNFFKEKIETEPLKNIEVRIKDQTVRGEVMLTNYGIEGQAIYMLSKDICDSFQKSGQTKIEIDLKPDLSLAEITRRLERKNPKESLSNHLRKKLNLSGISLSLLKELTSKEDMISPDLMAASIKSLSIRLESPRDIDEAISTRGGISFLELTENLELKKLPGVFACGEMLDWEAPTGGYLLQGCFSTSFRIAKYILSSKI